ncbi:MAG: hypothetical protein KC440_03100, partial [Nitrosarchaeum sp.]|nr:hypothetical protein [Nitrosarchaeum sp.]
KQDRMEEGLLFERRSDGKTIHCSRCEAIIIMTNLNLKQFEFVGINDCNIMLKEPHLIRKITY